jgi:hypothetical protein
MPDSQRDWPAVRSQLAQPWQDGYEAGLIAEWLRWLSTDRDHAGAVALGEQLRHLVLAARAADPTGDRTVAPADAARIAQTILYAIRRRA